MNDAQRKQPNTIAGCLVYLVGILSALGIWCGAWYLAALMVRLVFLG